MNLEVKISEKPVDYTESMKILENRVIDVLKGKKKELLWILEHKTTYTAGVSTKDSDILDKKIKVIKTNRGGKLTIHSPGQKVIYFVLNLNKRKKDIRALIRKIEKCIIYTLKDYDVKSHNDSKNIGIWVNENQQNKKIAAIGIKVKKWIAYHGFSINIDNDLSKYSGIIPCGLKNKKITNLKKLGVKNYDNFEKNIIKNFLNIFEQ